MFIVFGDDGVGTASDDNGVLIASGSNAADRDCTCAANARMMSPPKKARQQGEEHLNALLASMLCEIHIPGTPRLHRCTLGPG